MEEQKDVKQPVKKFAGIEVPPDLTKKNFFFLYFNTLLIGLLMVIPAILQPAFLKDVIKVSMDFFGSINGLLQNMSQIATLLFVGYVGILSDRTGRKILAIIGFIVLACCCPKFVRRIFCHYLCNIKLCPCSGSRVQ